jgi:hypothetical protein
MRTLWLVGMLAFSQGAVAATLSDCESLKDPTSLAWCRAAFSNGTKCAMQARRGVPYEQYCKAWAARRTDVCADLEEPWHKATCELLALRVKADDSSSELEELKKLDSDGKHGVLFIHALAKGDVGRCDSISIPYLKEICLGAVPGLQMAIDGPSSSVLLIEEEQSEQQVEEQQQVQLQLQVQSPESGDDPSPDAYRLETEATECATELQILVERDRNGTERAEFLDVQGKLALLVDRFEKIRLEARQVGIALTALRDDKLAGALRAVRTVGQIAGEFYPIAEGLKRDVAQHVHQERLDGLKLASTDKERREITSVVTPRSDDVTDEDVDEIDNWVGGSWSTINQVLFGAESEGARDARQLVVEQGNEDQKWQMDIDARVKGIDEALSHIPKRIGTSYRIMRPKDATVFGGKINPGDLIMSRGFFATSMVKGADGAGGGGGWGTVAGRVYLEITGVTGADLGPYQTSLQGEREVLFGRDTVFEVEAIEVGDNGTAFVLVKERTGGVEAGTIVKDPFDGKEIVVGE